MQLACRLTSYGPHADGAAAHLASLGVRFVELHAPPTERAAAVRDELAAHGLYAITLQGVCDVSRADVAADVARQLETWRLFDARYMLIPARDHDMPFDVATARLREAGNVAADFGVTILLETHPPLATNADVALRTLDAINHPAVRLNFDTANIPHYTRGGDTLNDLRRALHATVGVHLKDARLDAAHDHGFQDRYFPAAGEGDIDFPAVLSLLREHDFAGPCTIEIDVGAAAGSREDVQARVAKSVRHFQALGLR